MRLFGLLVQLACRDSEMRVARRLVVGRSHSFSLLFWFKINVFERKLRTVCGDVLTTDWHQNLIPKLVSFSDPKKSKNVKRATANLQMHRYSTECDVHLTNETMTVEKNLEALSLTYSARCAVNGGGPDQRRTQLLQDGGWVDEFLYHIATYDLKVFDRRFKDSGRLELAAGSRVELTA